MSANIIGSLIGGFMMTKSSGPPFFIIMGIIMLIAAGGMTFNRIPPLNHEPEHKGVVEEIKGTFEMMFDKRMMYLNLQILFTGFSISFWTGLLIPSIIFELKDTNGDQHLTKSLDTSKALYAMSMFGVGEIFGSNTMG